MTGRYLARRLVEVPFALFAILLITFLVVQYVPGDPAYALAGEITTPAEIEQIRRDYGFDRPVLAQFVTYAGRVVRGDLGESYDQGRPVADIIGGYARPTLLLTGTALVISTVMGLLLAIVAARRPFGIVDKAITTSMLVVYAVPGFWIAQLAIMYLVLELDIFPLQGYSEVGSGAPTGLAHLADVGRHLALPALVLAVTEVAAVTRVVRAGLIAQLNEDYVRTAAAKGLSKDEVLSRHALRNALLPMITLIGARVGFLLSGAVIVETIFAWPGLGTVLVAAVEGGDRPLMLGLALVASIAIVIANVLTDVAYRWADPRIQYD